VSLSLGPVDFRVIIQDLLASLHATTAADLEYWTEAELYEWADETVQRLARNHGALVDRDPVALSAAVPSYALPARHISTIHVAVAKKALAPLSVQEAEALDATWPETQAGAGAAPTNYLGDVAGTETVRFYPTPSATATADLVFHRFPEEVELARPLLNAPVSLAPYFGWRILAEALGKESKAKMPEVAQHFTERVALFDQVIQSYWGSAQ